MKIEEPSSRTLAIVVLAGLFGAGGFVFAFSDASPRVTVAMHIVVGALYFLVTGAIIGFFHPQRWFIAGLISLGASFMGLLMTAAALRGVSMSPDGPNLSAALATLFLPIVLSLVGGYLASRIGERFLPNKPSGQV